jgi:hypothetical protein
MVTHIIHHKLTIGEHLAGIPLKLCLRSFVIWRFEPTLVSPLFNKPWEINKYCWHHNLTKVAFGKKK